MRYTVELERTVVESATVEVEADSESAAEEAARKMFAGGEIDDVHEYVEAVDAYASETT